MEAALYAYLSYRDAPAALEWLQKVGFEVVRRQEGPDGSVVHAELRMGQAIVMIASNDEDYRRPPLIGRSTGQGLYLLVDDVNAFYDKAIAAGGFSVIEPEETAWGSKRCRVLDPEGQEWSAVPTNPEKSGESWECAEMRRAVWRPAQPL